jgi:glycosyltransferase involved in cell wall biosynthesis
MKKTETLMKISIIIPCYQSAKSLPAVAKEIREEFAKHNGYDYQLILVNDCSPDNTLAVIAELCREEQKIVGIDLAKNFGQASAKLAGLPYAAGDAIIYMDDDGQHPASGIFKMLDKINEGYDIVYARFPRKKHGFLRRLSSYCHHKTAELSGTKPKGISVSSFTAWSRFAVDSLKNYSSPFPSAGSYLYRITTRVANVDVEHRDRIAGNSGYTLRKLVALWLTAFTNFSFVPLRAASFLGFSCAVIGFVFGAFIVVRKLFFNNILSGYTSNMAMLLFIGGTIMMILGVLGEYLGRIYMTISGLPQYVVRNVINQPPNR